MTQPTAAVQAVVVIHGMGDQHPMDTVKSFVDAVWGKDTVITANGLPNPQRVWSKPDDRTGSLELRRITTRESIRDPSPGAQFPGGVRTDFYELYWADLTAGSPWEEFVGWIYGLLFRPLSRVPRGVRLAWVVLWIASFAVALIALLAALPADVWKKTTLPWVADWQWALALVAGYFGVKLHKTASETFGRVVRYTKADPGNIAARQAVRERGLKLLEALHEGAYYKRIVIVSHSLGTILAHDLLSYFWAQRDAARRVDVAGPAFDALCALEEAAAEVDNVNPSAADLKKYYEAQRKLRIALASRPPPAVPVPPARPPADTRWLISDFVTLGSPLTHADFLIAASDTDLEQRKIERELSQSPPFREDLDDKVFKLAQATHKLPVKATAAQSKLISFPPPSAPNSWELHHAAPFAVVRWTNIYDPASLVYRGDIIGGPLAGKSKFGPAITDINLKTVRGQSSSFTHTKYWTIDDEPKHIEELRNAVNLLDKP